MAETEKPDTENLRKVLDELDQASRESLEEYSRDYPGLVKTFKEFKDDIQGQIDKAKGQVTPQPSITIGSVGVFQNAPDTKAEVNMYSDGKSSVVDEKNKTEQGAKVQSPSEAKGQSHEPPPEPLTMEQMASIDEKFSKAGWGSYRNTIITYNDKMLDIFKKINNVAETNTPILIYGETGTGKESIVRAIHEKSNRPKDKFAALNCGQIPEGVMGESFLFGHVKGAFTGADKDQKGLFEECNEGTIFLDEIQDLAPDLQARLLRVLQEGTIIRLKDSLLNLITVNVRVVCGGHRDLEVCEKEGKFRKDLLYRINVIHIALPPIRDRKEDILPLAIYFLDKFAKEHKKSNKRLHDETIQHILSYNWRENNVRELSNEMERICLEVDDKIIYPFHLKSRILSPFVDSTLNQEDGNKETLVQTVSKMLAEMNGNQMKVHKILLEKGIITWSYPTFNRWVNKYKSILYCSQP